MTQNPYYQLLALIRAQQSGGPQFFLARLTRLAPPLLEAEGAQEQPALVPAELTLTEADKQRDFLCLWLEGRVLLLGRLEEPDWR